MAILEEDQDHEAAQLVFDALLCGEESFEEDLREESDNLLQNISKKHQFFSLDLKEHDLFSEDGELKSLILKEQNLVLNTPLFYDGFLVEARKEALVWIFRAKAQFGFTPLTTVLAVNYFDRFISTPWFHKEKPWMSHLAAVACLSLAAKIEETQVPLLLDLQVEDSKYIFEVKTIQRMELLVLSALQWQMHPVTPVSFFHHVTWRLGSTTNLHWQFLRRCERLLLSVIAVSDFKVMCLRPSVLATAIMLHVIAEIKADNLLDYQNWLISVMMISKDKLDECCKLIKELLASRQNCNKRKQISTPNSPNGIIDTTFSCETSNDSWAVASVVLTTSPEPQIKRTRQVDMEQQTMSPLLFGLFKDAVDVSHHCPR